MTTVYVGEFGFNLEVHFTGTGGADTDISNATTLSIETQDPQGFVVNRSAQFKTDGIDGRMIRTVVAGEIIGPGGTWKYRGLAISQGSQIETGWVELTVIDSTPNSQIQGNQGLIGGSGDPPSDTIGKDGENYVVLSGDSSVAGKVYGPKVDGQWPTTNTWNVLAQRELANTTPTTTDDTAGSVGGSVKAAKADHKHPRDAEIPQLRTQVGTAAGSTDFGAFGSTFLDNGASLRALLIQIAAGLDNHEGRLDTLEIP